MLQTLPQILPSYTDSNFPAQPHQQHHEEVQIALLHGYNMTPPFGSNTQDKVQLRSGFLKPDQI